jgi:hypothetical protein
MGDFLTLPVDIGEGPYHFNRYRIAFEKPANISKEDLAADFVRNFPSYFNSQFATVDDKTGRDFHGRPTLKFHGISDFLGLHDFGRYHNDWVVQLNVNPRGFLVQTLERTFRLSEDAKMAVQGAIGGAVPGAITGAAAGGIASSWAGGLGAVPGALVFGGVGAVAGGVPAYNANFKHFLAGRRSWRLDDASVFGVSGNFLILETAAVERFSCEFYLLNDKIQNLEAKVPDIWNAMLSNFVGKRGLTIATTPMPGAAWLHSSAYKTDYVVKNSYDTISGLRSDAEFILADRVHVSGPYHLIP